MRKFYYQDKPYEVPPVEYRDNHTVTETLELRPACSCSALLKNHQCREIMCEDCIFSLYNSEARLEYLKTEGYLKMENNDTMPELKGGMLLSYGDGDNNEWILTVNEESGYVIKLDRVIVIKYILPQLNQSMIKSIFYRDDSIMTASDIEACIGNYTGMLSYKNINHWERKEVKELTMSYLEKHFGCRVKIVKDN